MKMFKVEFLHIEKGNLEHPHLGHFDTHQRITAYIEADTADQAASMFRKEQPEDRIVGVVESLRPALESAAPVRSVTEVVTDPVAVAGEGYDAKDYDSEAFDRENEAPDKP